MLRRHKLGWSIRTPRLFVLIAVICAVFQAAAPLAPGGAAAFDRVGIASPIGSIGPTEATGPIGSTGSIELSGSTGPTELTVPGAAEFPQIAPGQPVTVTARWVWGAQPAEFDMAGLAVAGGGDHDSLQFRLSWEREERGWIPAWTLRFYFPPGAGEEPEAVSLITHSPRAGESYEAAISYHPAAGLVAVRLNRIDGDATTRLASGAYHTARALGPPAAFASSPAGGGGTLQSLVLAPGFRPVGDVVVVGEETASGGVVPVRFFEEGGELVVQVDSPVIPPGEYQVALVGGNQAERGDQAEIRLRAPEVRPSGKGARQQFKLSLDGVPAGPARLVVTYVEGDRPIVVHDEPLIVGRLSAEIRLGEVDRNAGLYRGLLLFEAPMPGVRATLSYEFSKIVLDEERSALAEDQAGPRRTVWTGPVELGAIPIEVSLPEQSGYWALRFSLATTPEVAVRLEGAETRLRNDLSTQTAWVAVTDQMAQRILVLDPRVKDWNDSEAVRWSWRPETSNGFGGFLGAWGNPSGVKLRKNDVFGGYWMVVTDSRGLAAIVPYPEGDERKWARVVGGNPHSAELLPDGNIAVAASTGGWVRVYASSQGPDASHYVEFPLKGAHGVLWDPKFNLLWAVGDDDLVALEVAGTPDAPQLKKVRERALPTRGGHDLSPVYGEEDRLWVTSGSSVYQYDKVRDAWIEDYFGADALLRRSGVKGVGDLPDGQVVAVWPKAGSLYSWTTDTVHLFFPDEVRQRDNSAIYKARIWVADYQ